MSVVSVSIIVCICYIIAELYKIIFQDKKDSYKYIPVVTTVLGGILGILIFYISPDLIMHADDPFTALFIGLISGATSTGTNQIIKQLMCNDKSNS